MKNKILFLFVLLIPRLGFGEDVKIEIITDFNASTQTIIIDNPATQKHTLVLKFLGAYVSLFFTYEDYYESLEELKFPEPTIERPKKLKELEDEFVNFFQGDDLYADYWNKLDRWKKRNNPQEPKPKTPKRIRELEAKLDKENRKFEQTEEYKIYDKKMQEWEKQMQPYYKARAKPWIDFHTPFKELFGDVGMQTVSMENEGKEFNPKYHKDFEDKYFEGNYFIYKHTISNNLEKWIDEEDSEYFVQKYTFEIFSPYLEQISYILRKK
ncbi:MAG: hypothetical protein VX130_01435 [Verrucomicrobiota bacterium]|nr:hypothetical protein [Verrucomicrobiota bacterium]